MSFAELIAGPQLIGIVFLIAGVVTTKYPPKKINPMYGYRSKASMKNQRTWDEANNFAARLMVKHGAILTIAGLLMEWAYQVNLVPVNVEAIFRPALMIGLAVISAITLKVTTEQHLKRIFPQKA